MTNPSELSPVPPFRIPKTLSELQTCAIQEARKLTKAALENAGSLPAGASEADHIEAATDYLTDRADALVEQYDQALPFIGAYMDLPPVDYCEKQAIRALARALVVEAMKEANR